LVDTGDATEVANRRAEPDKELAATVCAESAFGASASARGIAVAVTPSNNGELAPLPHLRLALRPRRRAPRRTRGALPRRTCRARRDHGTVPRAIGQALCMQGRHHARRDSQRRYGDTGSIPPPHQPYPGLASRMSARSCQQYSWRPSAIIRRLVDGLVDPGVHGSELRCQRPPEPAGSGGRGAGLCGICYVLRTAQVTAFDGGDHVIECEAGWQAGGLVEGVELEGVGVGPV
jgi:hypothetical protein